MIYPLLEAVIMAAILIAVDVFLLPGLFFNYRPNPLWIVVLYVAMRYGTIPGMIGGLVSAGAYLYILTRQGANLQDMLHLQSGRMVEPALFVFVGLLIGESTEKARKRIEALGKRSSSLESQLNESEIGHAELERSYRALEARLAGRADTVRSLYDGLAKITNSETEGALWANVTDVVCQQLRAEACGVWGVSPPGLLGYYGAVPDPIPPLGKIALKRRGIVTVVDWMDREEKGSPGAEVAGLVIGEGLPPVVVGVGGMEFARFSRSSLLVFDLILGSARQTRMELINLSKLHRASVDDPEMELYSEGYFRARLREQMLLSMRYKTPLGLAACRLDGEYPGREGERLQVVLARCAQSALRASDGLSFFHSRKAYAVLLPDTDAVGVKIVMDKVSSNFSSLGLESPQTKKPIGLVWKTLDPSDGNNVDVEECLDRLLSNVVGTEKC